MIAGYDADFEDDSKESVVLLQASRMARSSVWCQAQSGEGERERASKRDASVVKQVFRNWLQNNCNKGNVVEHGKGNPGNPLFFIYINMGRLRGLDNSFESFSCPTQKFQSF